MVGKKIKEYLEAHGISQTYVSKKTGIDLTKLNLALNGNRKLMFEEYELICGALDVGPETFLEARLPENAGNTRK